MSTYQPEVADRCGTNPTMRVAFGGVASLPTGVSRKSSLSFREVPFVPAK
jgi:hypothetical protein